MLQKLSRGDKIEIKSEDLSHWKFLKVGETAAVEQKVPAGIESFIRSFFHGRGIKEDVSFLERNAVIYQLFRWQIGNKIDDETGYLYIPVLPGTSNR